VGHELSTEGPVVGHRVCVFRGRDQGDARLARRHERVPLRLALGFRVDFHLRHRSVSISPTSNTGGPSLCGDWYRGNFQCSAGRFQFHLRYCLGHNCGLRHKNDIRSGSAERHRRAVGEIGHCAELGPGPYSGDPRNRDDPQEAHSHTGENIYIDWWSRLASFCPVWDFTTPLMADNAGTLSGSGAKRNTLCIVRLPLLSRR